MRVVILASVLVVVGCGSDGERLVAPPPVLPPTFTVASQSWAGGELEIRSAAFAGDTTLKEIRIGGVVVPVSRTSDSVMTVVVPDTMAGPREVTLVQEGEARVIGTVAVSGVTAVVQRSEVVSGNADLGVPYPQDGAASLMTVVGGRVALLDYDAGTATTLPAEHGIGSFNPGPTFDPDVWLTRKGSADPIEVWRLRPVPVKIDEIPPLGIPGSSRRVLAMPAPDTIIMVPTRTLTRFIRQPDGSWIGGGGLPNVQAEDAAPMLISPARNRWLVGPSTLYQESFDQPAQPSHLAVWKGALERAFIIPDLQDAWRYAFSPSGDELAIIGQVPPDREQGERSLLVVDPEDGTERHRRQLVGSSFTTVAYDRTRPLLYVLVIEDNRTFGNNNAVGAVTLEVIDRRDWQVVGKVRLPETPLTEWVVLPSNQGRVHLIQRLTSGTTAYTVGPVF